jgi:hypothetical protein
MLDFSLTSLFIEMPLGEAARAGLNSKDGRIRIPANAPPLALKKSLRLIGSINYLPIN